MYKGGLSWEQKKKKKSQKENYYCDVLIQRQNSQKYLCLCNKIYHGKHAVKRVNECVKYHLRTFCGLKKQ